MSASHFCGCPVCVEDRAVLSRIHARDAEPPDELGLAPRVAAFTAGALTVGWLAWRAWRRFRWAEDQTGGE